MRKLMLMVMLLSIHGVSWAAGGEALIQQYRLEAGQGFSAGRGKALWTKEVKHASGEAVRSCTACHGSDLSRPGKHVRTGKAIPPMARSARADALTDEKKIQKWLTRNCKWTLGRECTVLEKGDVLSYLLQGEK